MLRWLRRHPRPPKTVIPPPTGAIGTAVPPSPAFPNLSLASATRDYAQAVAMGTLERLNVRDRDRLAIAMGPDIWMWQRARRLTAQMPWRASPNVAERIERTRAVEQMTLDIPTWERALVEVDAETRRATLYGSTLPPPLDVPAAVMRLIECRRIAALEQASRRRQRADEGSGGPALRLEPELDHAPTPIKPA